MKKLFVIIACVFFINATLDSENIELEIERLGENSVRITWSINYEEYDRIVLEVLNQNNAERTRYILPSLKGAVELCCFEGDVGATITITKSIVIDKSDEDCSALSCIEYVKEFTDQKREKIEKFVKEEYGDGNATQRIVMELEKWIKNIKKK